jgi:predicted amidohydrolase
MKVRGIQFSPILGNLKKNLDTHSEQVERAIREKFQLVVFPELSLTGYHLMDIVSDVALTPSSPEIKKLKELSRGIDIVVGAPFEEIPGIIYNTALYFSKGDLLHTHRKVQLPNFGMFQEEMIFKAGDSFCSFKINDFTVGLIICREILFPIHAYLYFLQGVDFLIGISNSPHRMLDKDHFKSIQLWENMGYLYSVFYHQHYIFVNRTGYEEGIGFPGGSFFARSGKGIVQRAASLEDDCLDVEIDKEAVRRARLGGNYLRDDKPEVILKELKRILNA